MLAKRSAKLDKVYGVLPWMEIFTLVPGFITAKCKPPTPAGQSDADSDARSGEGPG